MKTCKRFENCGFVKKHQHSNHIDCRGFIYSYCKGNKMNECARMDYFLKKGEVPSDDMLPSGKMIESENTYEPYTKDTQQFY